MSNNSNILSGLFRSISRRGQRRGADAEENDLPPRADVDMESQQSYTSPASRDISTHDNHVNSAVVNVEDGDHSDSSMPSLEEVSDSDSGDIEFDDEDEAVRNHFMVTIGSSQAGGDGNAQFTRHIFGLPSVSNRDEDEDMPSLEAIRPDLSSSLRPQGTRRARVEDDVDGDSERDRRHPSQRASNNQSGSSSPAPVSPAYPGHANEHVHRGTVFSNVSGGAPGVGVGVDATGPVPQNSHFRGHQQLRFPPHLMPQTGFDVRADATQYGNPEFSNSGSPGNNMNVGATPQDTNNQQRHGATPNSPNSFAALLQSLLQAATGGQTGAAFTTTLNGVPVGHGPQNAAAPNGGDSGFLGNLFTAMSGMEGATFTFNTNLPGGIPLFDFRPAQERENPERAKVLVDGLEEVPVGLIRRLERVSPESSGCAICWEKLLEQDAEYLKEEEEQEESEAVSKAGRNQSDEDKSTDASSHTSENEAPFISDPSTDAPSSSSASKESSLKNKVPKYPRIVTLPCSHVFHADCLIPWFTRPRQTTCPTCRFNIDPEDLTRGVGARRRAAASATTGGRRTEVLAGEDVMPSASARMNGNRTIDPATGLPVPLGDSAQGEEAFVFNGRLTRDSTDTPARPSLPGMIRSEFSNRLPPGVASIPRTAPNQNGNNAQGTFPGVPQNTVSNRSGSGTYETNSSHGNTSFSSPTVNDVDIDPATLIPPGAPRMSRMPLPRPWLNEDELRGQIMESFFSRMSPYNGQPGELPGVQANPAPAPPNPRLNNPPQSPAHPLRHLHPQGNTHHHHPGDSYVTIGFDFVLNPNAHPFGPRDATPSETGTSGNTPQSRSSAPGVDHSNNTPNTDSSHVTPDNAPHQVDSSSPSGTNTDAEYPNQGDPGGVEFHAFGVNFGAFNPSSFDEDFMEAPDINAPQPQEDSQGPVTSSNVNSSVPILRFNSRATSNVPATNQPPGAERPGNNVDTPTNDNAQPNSNASPRIPDISSYLNSMFGAATPVATGTHRTQFASRGGSRPRLPPQPTARGGTPTQQRRQWAPPPPPGLTLRQTIERREREAGLRCWDVSCGLAPDDDCPDREIPDERKRQVKIQQEAVASTSSSQKGSGDSKGKGKEKADEEPKYVCEHTFHTPCLVTAQRVALNGAEEVIVGEGKFVQVSCPICRANGVLSRDDWEDGVQALESDLD